MIKRTVEIASQSYLYIKHRQLCVEQRGTLSGSIPTEDIGVLVLAHPAITITQRALNALKDHQATVVFCDERYMPQAALMPMEGHSLHAKMLRAQIQWKKPMKKRAWQQIVRAKIEAQAGLLEHLGKDGAGLTNLAAKVRSGDPDNLEAQAAVLYWRRLFGPTFRRDPKAGGANPLLNYGYSILRAGTARALCAAGLHPALGLYHRNQYNAFALADDLMEPLRPAVDLLAFQWTQKGKSSLDRETRVPFLQLLAAEAFLEGRHLPLMTALHHYVTSLRTMGCGDRKTLEVPIL